MKFVGQDSKVPWASKAQNHKSYSLPAKNTNVPQSAPILSYLRVPSQKLTMDEKWEYIYLASQVSNLWACVSTIY